MNDVQSLDQALLALQKELQKFKTLHPQLEAVRNKADEIVGRFKTDVKIIRSDAAKAYNEAKGEYVTLSATSKDQFDRLFAAWNKQIAQIENSAGMIDPLIQSISGMSDKYAHLAERMAEVAKIVHDLNLSVRFDKLDALISGAMAAMQSIQSRFDLLKKDLDTGFRNSLLELTQRLQSTESTLKLEFTQRLQSAESALKKDAKDLNASLERQITTQYATMTKELGDKFSGLKTEVMSGFQLSTKQSGLLRKSLKKTAAWVFVFITLGLIANAAVIALVVMRKL